MLQCLLVPKQTCTVTGNLFMYNTIMLKRTKTLLDGEAWTVKLQRELELN